jgi:hypothetical protein
MADADETLADPRQTSGPVPKSKVQRLMRPPVCGLDTDAQLVIGLGFRVIQPMLVTLAAIHPGSTRTPSASERKVVRADVNASSLAVRLNSQPG